jgi:transcriptional regulator with XRE-family HTH domain
MSVEGVRMAEDETFASVLERLRIGRGLSPAKLAKELHEWEGNVSRWRHGGGISVAKIRKIADFFGVPPAPLERLAGYPESATVTKENPIDPGAVEWDSLYYRFPVEERPRITAMVRAAANTFCEGTANSSGVRINHRGRRQKPGDIISLTRGLVTAFAVWLGGLIWPFPHCIPSLAAAIA